MPKRLVFTGKQQVSMESFELPALGEADVRVRTICTLMSTGTENIVFNRLFDPGTSWDGWVKYPFYPGYLNVGTVEAVGAKVTNVRAGDRVVSRHSHCSHYVGPANGVWKLPEGIESESAAWFGLAKIAAHGARAAQYELGDSVLVIGAGPIGQMSLRWANAAGVRHLVMLDPIEKRLAMARRGGATAVVGQPAAQAGDAVRDACGGRLPRVVVDTTGHPQVFAAALTLADRFGRVVLIGDTGTPSQQHLTGDVLNRGLTIVGVHDTHESPLWNSDIIFPLFAALAGSGRFDLSGLITHRFPANEFAEAYRTANEKRGETMGISFEWDKGKFE